MQQATDWTPLSGLYEWERRQPEVVYLTQPDAGSVTDYRWADVGNQVRRMAAHLQSLRLPPGSRIALLSKNCAHWIMADLAIWMAGHVSVPIYPSLNAETVRYILAHSESQLLFLGRLDDWQGMQAGVPDNLPIITLPGAPTLEPSDRVLSWADLIAMTMPLAGQVMRHADELATLVYTSGTTGLPKGVMISFGAFAVSASAVAQITPCGPDDRLLSYLPLAHVFERAVVQTMSLRTGCRVFFNDTLATFPEDLRRSRPTVFHSVPRLWVKFQLAVSQKIPAGRLQLLLKIPVLSGLIRRKVLTQLGLQDVRVALTGSAPLPPTVLSWYRELGLELLEGYGMSEDFSYSHLSLPGLARVGYVGYALNGVQRRIAENGEIQIKSPARMLGYYKAPEATAEAFTLDGYFKTGDMGEVDHDGRLRVTGRLKELFKTSKGKYVAPAPIENKLINHPQVEVVCVVGANQAQPIGLVMLDAAAQQVVRDDAARRHLEAELDALVTQVNATLDPHEQLNCLVVVREQWTIANGFLTPTMKIKRNVIEQCYDAHVESWCSAGRKVIWA